MSAKTLVIGYGNTLRGDDGAGVRAAERIGQTHDDVDVVTTHELTPELAEKMTGYERVVFIDASANATALLRRDIKPATEQNAQRSHALSPEELLNIAVQLYNFHPQTITLWEISARKFDFGEQLSDLTRDAVNDCVEQFSAWHGQNTDPSPSTARLSI